MKFITDHQASPLIAQAAERIFGSGAGIRGSSGIYVAAQVYGELAKFAAGVKVLSQATPNVPTILEKAAFAQAAALDAQARKLLKRPWPNARTSPAAGKIKRRIFRRNCRL